MTPLLIGHNSGFDKESWGRGPWLSEPDYLTWVDGPSGYHCAIMRSGYGSLNGYVAVPRAHPLYGVHRSARVRPPQGSRRRLVSLDRLPVVDLFLEAFEEEDGLLPVAMALDCHCGLTYAGKGNGSPGMRHPNRWWFGFDCGHADDYCPAMMTEIREIGRKRGEPLLSEGLFRPETYKTFGYVEADVINLARQLEAWGHDPGEDNVEVPEVQSAAEAADQTKRRRKGRADARPARRSRRTRSTRKENKQ
jgi:hypothetical protein